MISVGVRQLKNSLTRYLRMVDKGHAVLVMNRDRAVAMLKKPDQSSAQSVEERMAALIMDGRLMPAEKAGPRRAFKPVRLKGTPASSQILEDRR